MGGDGGMGGFFLGKYEFRKMSFHGQLIFGNELKEVKPFE